MLMQIVHMFFKNTARNSPKHAIKAKNLFFFFWGGPSTPQIDRLIEYGLTSH